MLPPTVSLGQRYERVPGVAPSRRRRLLALALLLVLLFVVYAMGSVGGAHVLRLVRIHVRGRVVDAATGEPLAGVCIVPMWDLTPHARESAVVWKERLAQDPESAYRGGLTGSDGTFSFEHTVHWCVFEKGWSLGSASRLPPRFFGAQGLLVGRPGHEDVVVETQDASWSAGPSDLGADASLDMGDVRYRE